jgi:hypothetical protein
MRTRSLDFTRDFASELPNYFGTATNPWRGVIVVPGEMARVRDAIYDKVDPSRIVDWGVLILRGNTNPSKKVAGASVSVGPHDLAPGPLAGGF